MLCLVHFYEEWTDFRLAEMCQLLKLLNEDFHVVNNAALAEDSVFLLVELPSAEVAARLCSRSVLVRSIYEVWAHEESFAQLVEKVKALHATNRLPAVPSGSSSWCVELQAYCKTLKKEEKDGLRDAFSFFDLPGPIALKNADTTISINLDFSQHKREIQSGTYAEAGLPPVPCYCGRLLGRGGMKDALKKYHLQKRLFLGPTTLDHALALIMCNLAGVSPHHMVLDPFVGTASILIAAAHLKAHTVGTDIDIRVLKGGMYAGANRDKKIADAVAMAGAAGASSATLTESQKASVAQGAALANKHVEKRDIIANFKDYGLPPPELIRMDLHSFERHWQMQMVDNAQDGVFDAIVTDPPYGIRAGGRKSGKKEGAEYHIDREKRSGHVPATQNYPVEEVMLDLMHAAARLLVVGGKLCYLIPTPYDFHLSDLPQHPCLQVEQLCLQGLSTRHGRHAVLLRKHCAYSVPMRAHFDAYRLRVMSGQDVGGFGSLMSKLQAALDPGAHEDEDVVKRKSKLCVRRQQSKATREVYREAQRASANAEGGAEHATKKVAAEAPAEAVFNLV